MSTRNLVYTALMTAIICVLGLVPSIPLPIMPVPIVLQNIGIFLAGIILGRKYGALSVIVFLLLAATGLPVLSGGRGGIGVFAGPSAGFLFLYPVVAYLIGLVRDRYLDRINFTILFVATLVVGILLLDVVGTIIMGFIIHIPVSKAIVLSLTFMPGDIVKGIIASLIGATMLNHSRFKNLIQ
ncbi:biotin transporter BioY [Staphylococcus devriesei]|uniref:Biotin transporter n=1 Tax=Staphylococcus devriesei TaxID=586733 RepID=A0A2K4DFY7_9STAP|nr:biotin transporter BioY [Staphylococcus devriesei]MCE5090059.1 biotin transporter BioY [Staphylococcus devriesei]MCE5097853.1 biotin transporter BioY [Staphylococcus devriesei]PNZ85757.1 biotin transporter BioY [Staphylococcus devriesei]PTE72429.1 biotin transporter BioY [Staphylococcus devriesei]PTF14020.1 biotin transporter BioY [Staphylococcus devriesei]